MGQVMTAVVVRAEALFVSDLQRSEHPSTESVQAAVEALVDDLGEQGCAERVAQEFGDHPERAVERMCWCRSAVLEAFS